MQMLFFCILCIGAKGFCLATIGADVFFVRRLRLSHFLIWRKKKMKKTLSLILALVLLLSPVLTGCAGDGNTDGDTTTEGEKSDITTAAHDNEDETTGEPENTTSEPYETTKEPEVTTSPNGSTTAEPEETTTEPEETTTTGFVEDWEEGYNKNASSGLIFVSNGDGTCYVNGIGTCADTEIIIPSRSPEGDKVISIGDSAFEHCTKLTSITIPDSVTSIGDSAFERCTKLTNITIPDSVTSIGAEAFLNISYFLNAANWENGVLYIGKHLIKAKDYISGECSIKPGTLTIADLAFERCYLTSINIPDSVTNIGDRAFFLCRDLTSITIPDSVTSIGKDAFLDCPGLISITVDSDNKAYFSEGNCLIKKSTNTLILGCKNSIIPSSVKTIGEFAFSGCSGLTSIAIPNSVTSIEYGAFTGCSGLTEITVDFSNTVYLSTDNCLIKKSTNTLILGCKNSIIPNNVTSIGYHAFNSCDGLTSITIPDSVTSIGDYAFFLCRDLTSITIPNGVTIIGDFAFSSCSDLLSVTMPNSVTSIGDSAFLSCDNLTNITFEGTKTEWAAIEKGSAWKNNVGIYTVHCTDGDIAKSDS